MKQLYFLISAVFVSINLFSVQSAIAATPKKEQALLQELTGIQPGKFSDRTLYSEIAEAYESKDLPRVQTKTALLLKLKPGSVLAPKALYSQAMLQAEKRRFTDALKSISKLEKNYPKSSRIVSAAFLKAMIFKRIHLPEQASAVLRDVNKKFPGSPEAYRAVAELKILKQQVN